MKLRKVISGGQTGADQGGLYAARIAGIETGGTAPKGFLTENGPMPDLLKSFGLTEHIVAGYPARTEKNVTDAHATIRFASDFSSAGERATFRFCAMHDREVMSINVLDPKSCQEVVDWLNANEVEVLNVAGNRETTCPGLCKFVTGFLLNVFWEMKGTEKRRFSVPELTAHISDRGVAPSPP